MLKSCRNFERSERSEVWKLGAFGTVDFLSSLSNLRQRFWSVRRFDNSEISNIWKQSLSKVRSQSFKKRSTSNALRFRRRTLLDFDVERSEISTLNARRCRRRTLGDSYFKILTLESSFEARNANEKLLKMINYHDNLFIFCVYIK